VSEPSSTRLSLAHTVDMAEAVPLGLFLERVVARGLKELRTDGWPTAEGSLEALGSPVARIEHRRHKSALYEQDGVLYQVILGGAHVQVIAAAPSTAPLDELFLSLREKFRPPDPSSVHEVPVTFWTYSPHGPQPSWRSIGVPGWEEIESNYSSPTRAQLETIMRGFEPAHGGQLILWHGEAGTGKTFALRALAWEWRDWCQFYYIVDPDSFFGQHADYLMSVLMQPNFPMMMSGGGWVGHMGFGTGDEEGEEDKAWRVLVLEDTGELLSADARASMGQGLSRFLNLVDGLIGQGLRVLVLVTTNEEVRRLHPAVARPGRCAANIQFEPLTAEEASRWLEQHGRPAGAGGRRTLASLYAELEGRDLTEMALVGFGS
jgi:ATPase family protein associated with various cellular activities (AAA)